MELILLNLNISKQLKKLFHRFFYSFQIIIPVYFKKSLIFVKNDDIIILRLARAYNALLNDKKTCELLNETIEMLSSSNDVKNEKEWHTFWLQHFIEPKLNDAKRIEFQWLFDAIARQTTNTHTPTILIEKFVDLFDQFGSNLLNIFENVEPFDFWIVKFFYKYYY